MKKKMIICAVLAIVGVTTVSAAMDDKTFTIANIGVATNSQTLVVRGELYGVAVDLPPVGGTALVTVATPFATVFTKSVTADGVWYPRAAVCTTAAGSFTNSVDTGGTAFFDRIPLAGDVTVTVSTTTGGCAGTNYVIKLYTDK